MQVVILAAGRGARLGAIAEGLPKCLLEIRGKRLYQHQLEIMADCGAAPVLMVVGYAADLVRDSVGQRAETVLNPRYDRTNSLYSLWLARQWVKGPVIVLNSDVLFDREIAERLVRAGPDHLVYDSTSGDAAEQMKVRMVDGLVRGLSKDLPRGEAAGENLGMVYLGAETAAAVFAEADRLLAAGREMAFWAEALGKVAGERAIRAIDVAGLPWVEIDAPYDLDRARREVWPAIRKRAGRPRRRWRAPRIAAAASLLAVLGAGAWVLSSIASDDPGAWEPLPAETGRRVTIKVKNAPQEWYEARPGETVALPVTGPRKLRIDVRALLPSGMSQVVPYAVPLTVDGGPPKVHRFTARLKPDIAIAHQGFAVCDRDKAHIKIAPGDHVVTVGPVDGPVAGILVRSWLPE